MGSKGGDTPLNRDSNANHPSNRPSVPTEPLMNGAIATVEHWVSAASDALTDANRSATPEAIYDVLTSWSNAPDVSRPQVERALNRKGEAETADTPLFDF